MSASSYAAMFGCALFLSWILAPVAGRLALRVGCVDRPGGRKIHARNVPYFGGVALFLSFLPVFGGVCLTSGSLPVGTRAVLKGILAGGGVILATGLVDDLFSTPPWVKLSGQIAAAILLASFGLRIEFLTNPLGGDIRFGAVVGGALTVLWVVSMVNAMNLIDGLDGLATGVALIGSVTLFAVAANRSDTVDMVITAILAGSCLGFLRHNFFPAKIFLGDAGSMFLGFVLAVTGIQGLQKGATVMALMIPLAALAVPVLDTLLAIIRRSKVKRNIFAPDREHLHHRLVRLGIPAKKVVLLLYFLCIHLGITAFVLTLIPSEYTVMILLLLAMGIVFLIKTLGFIEEKMAIRLRESEKDSMTDEETGLYTFGYLSRRVIEEINRCDRYGNRSFSLLVFEMGGLREAMEKAGHRPGGSRLFRSVAGLFRENVRSSDVVSYLGDESFVVMTPDEGEGSRYLVERLKTIFSNRKNELDCSRIEMVIRKVDYPGNKGIVEELLQDAVEVS